MVFILGKLVEQLFFRDALTILLFRSEILWDWELRHDRVGLDTVDFNFVCHFKSIFKGFRDITEDFRHFIGSFQPFLLSICHTLRIAQQFSRRQAHQSFVGFGVFLLHEMDVVGADHLNAKFLCDSDKLRIHPLLCFIHACITIRFISLMTLDFYVIVVAKQILEPFCRSLSRLQIIRHDLLWKFTSQTSGADNQILVILHEQILVDTWTVVITVDPSLGNDFTKILIAMLVFSNQDQVPTTGVGNNTFARLLYTESIVMVGMFSTGTITLAADNRFENLIFQFGDFLRSGSFSLIRRFRIIQNSLLFTYCSLRLLIHLDSIVCQLLDTKHVAMVSQSHSVHSCSQTFVNQVRHLTHSIQNRIVGVDMKVNEFIFHLLYIYKTYIFCL